MQRAWVHWRYIASMWKCLKFASVDSVKAYPTNFTMSPGQPVMVSYCRHRLGSLFPVQAQCREQGWGTGMLPRAFQWAGEALCFVSHQALPQPKKTKSRFWRHCKLCPHSWRQSEAVAASNKGQARRKQKVMERDSRSTKGSFCASIKKSESPLLGKRNH